MPLLSMGNAPGHANPARTAIAPCLCGPKLDGGIAVEHAPLTHASSWSPIAEVVGDNQWINQISEQNARESRRIGGTSNAI